MLTAWPVTLHNSLYDHVHRHTPMSFTHEVGFTPPPLVHLCLHVGGLVNEKIWPLVDLWSGPWQLEAPLPDPALGTCILPAFSAPKSCPKDTALRQWCVLGRSGRHVWLPLSNLSRLGRRQKGYGLTAAPRTTSQVSSLVWSTCSLPFRSGLLLSLVSPCLWWWGAGCGFQRKLPRKLQTHANCDRFYRLRFDLIFFLIYQWLYQDVSSEPKH